MLVIHDKVFKETEMIPCGLHSCSALRDALQDLHQLEVSHWQTFKGLIYRPLTVNGARHRCSGMHFCSVWMMSYTWVLQVWAEPFSPDAFPWIRLSSMPEQESTFDSELPFQLSQWTQPITAQLIALCFRLISGQSIYFVFCRAVTLKHYVGKSKKTLLVLICQFSCLLCRLHLKDLEKNQVKMRHHSHRSDTVNTRKWRHSLFTNDFHIIHVFNRVELKRSW